jgi:putative transposase
MTKKLKLKAETLNDILSSYEKPEDFAELWDQLRKAVIEKVMEGELYHHLGYPKGSKSLDDNTRNGTSSKTIYTDNGSLVIDAPRDRNASFEP